MTIQCTKLYCRRFSLSTFWFVDVLVCRCWGMSMFWFVDALVCRRFGLSTFRCVDVLACRHFGCRRFSLSTFWPVTYKRIHFNTSKPGYKYGHHFADDIFKWISWFFFKSHSPWVLLLEYDLHFSLHRLDIINIFPTFKYFNPSFSPLMPRIKYRTCWICIYLKCLKATGTSKKISIAYRKTAITPLLTHWSNCSLALSYRYVQFCCHNSACWWPRILV